MDTYQELLFKIGLFISLFVFVISIVYWFLPIGNRRTNRLMSALFLSIVLTNISLALYSLHDHIIWHLLRIHLPVQYTIAPLLYLYMCTLLNKRYTFKRKDVLHFVPAIILFLYSVPFFLQTALEKREWFYGLSRNMVHHLIFASLFYLQFTIYTIVVFVRLVKVKKGLTKHDEFSVQVRKWVTEIMVITLFVIGLNIIPVFITYQYIVIVPILVSIPVFVILLKTVLYPELFLLLGESQLSIDGPEISTTQIEEQYKDDLQKLMNDEKAFLDPKLSLPVLAGKIAITYHQLSSLINTEYNRNFNDFVNFYRIEEAKKRLLDTTYDNITIEALGKSVGFNSKAAFYASFKKFENNTPAQFKTLNLV